MENNQEVDILLKRQIKNDLSINTNGLNMPKELKNSVFSAISKPSVIKKLLNRINLLMEYEISIPIQVAAVCMIIIFVAGYLFYVPPMRITAEEIEAATINIESSQGGGISENNENQN